MHETRSADSFVAQARAAGGLTKKIAIGLLTLVSISITVASIIFFYKDIETSYRGWGVKMLAVIDSGQTGRIFALALSIVSTLIQVFAYLSVVTGLNFIKKSKLNLAITVAATMFDILLDINAQYVPENGAASFWTAVFVTLIPYTILSEVLFAFYAPISFSMVKTFVDDMMEDPYPEDTGGSMPRSSPSRPMPSRPSPGPSPEALQQREAMMRRSR